jgi:hypothetical protein
VGGRYQLYRGLFNSLCGIFIAVVVLRGCQSSFSSLARTGQQQSPPPPIAGYQVRFCDDPKVYDYTNRNPDHITITLHDNCFDDRIKFPKAWSTSWVQKSRNVGDWAAVWCDGHPVPSEARPYYEDMGNALQSCSTGSQLTDMFFEGIGTITFRRTSTNSGFAAQADDSDSRPANYRLTPNDPREGNPTGYTVAIQQCYREGEKIKCWGKVTNTTDASVHLLFYGGTAVDDEGNSFQIAPQYDEAANVFMSDTDKKLIPNVPLKFYITVPDGHMRAKTVTLAFRAVWEADHGQRPDDLTFERIPLQ